MNAPWEDKKLQELLTPRWSKYIPHEPTPKQQAFLWLIGRDAFYGGAAGGGKSDALLMAALQYVDTPGYNALLLRDTYANLTKPEGLMTRAHEWLGPWKDEVKWNAEQKTFHFLRYGSTLGFGHLDGPLSHFNYMSAAYQFIGIDEVVNIPKHQALYMFSRLRRLKGVEIPIRFRCASNPPQFEQLARGSWVKKRYVDPKTRIPSVVYIPAKMADNPYLDAEDYKLSLENLDPITRRQLEEGDWDITAKDKFFETDKIGIVDDYPRYRAGTLMRCWDMAATPDPKKHRSDDSGPAYTCGVKGTIVDDILYIIDVSRDRMAPGVADQFILNTARADGYETQQRAEQEPGSSGIRDMWNLSKVLSGYSFIARPSTGSKIVRARPLASAITMNRVRFVKAQWNQTALDELGTFPAGKIKDIVDSMSSLYSALVGAGSASGLIAPESETHKYTITAEEIYG